MLSPEELTKLVEKISKAQAYQRGAWSLVIEAGRKYAQMKAHGTYMENGRTITVSHSSVAGMEEMFKRDLLRAVEEAYAEDAQMGITISEILG